MAAYGPGETLCDDERSNLTACEGIENHAIELHYHAIGKLSLIYDPRYHFEFGGVKFVAFKQLYAMKKKRAELKDRIDVSMMEALIENKKLREYFTRFKHRLYYLRLKCRRYIVDLIKLIGLYTILKKYFVNPDRKMKNHNLNNLQFVYLNGQSN